MELECIEVYSKKTRRKYMKASIALVTIITEDVPRFVAFYEEVLGFSKKKIWANTWSLRVKPCSSPFVLARLMVGVTGAPSYQAPRQGQAFELALPATTPEEVDEAYAEIVAQGATPIKDPATMPWGSGRRFLPTPTEIFSRSFAFLPPQE